MKKKIQKLLYRLQLEHLKRGFSKAHDKEVKKLAAMCSMDLSPLQTEKDWLKKWSVFPMPINVNLYRYFASRSGENINIVPDDVFHVIIEPIMNSRTALPVYLDKNMYEKLLPAEYFPECIIRNMEYDYMDKDYKVLHFTDDSFKQYVLENKELISDGRIIVKPSLETGGGIGVRMFRFKGNRWISNDGKELTLTYLNKTYKKNFILQKCIDTSEFVSQFNPDSFNTFRICTYRSVVDDQLHILAGYLRIGDIGHFNDNIKGGGYACPIKNGHLSKIAFGKSYTQTYDRIYNVILDKELAIPNWDKITELVKDASNRLTPYRFICFDVILDKNNNPHLIEFNIKTETLTGPQTMIGPYLGPFTQEVIDYTVKHLNKIYYNYSLRP